MTWDIEELETLSPRVQKMLSDELRDTAMRLNNEAVLYPESDWRSVRALCSELESVSAACRDLSLGRNPAVWSGFADRRGAVQGDNK